MKIKKILPYLPSKLRKFVVRGGLPDLIGSLENITLSKVSDYHDLLECLSLLHDVYVKSGYMEQRIPPIRLIQQHLNIGTTVFMAKENENVVFTGTIFQDISHDLPIEEGFPGILDRYRSENRKICEFGCLASSPLSKIKKQQLPFLMNKLMFLYAHKVLNIDDIVITTHPKYQYIYEDILLFEKIGFIKNFGYVKGKPAVALRMDVRKEEDKIKRVYNNFPDNKNIYKFVFVDKSKSICCDEI